MFYSHTSYSFGNWCLNGQLRKSKSCHLQILTLMMRGRSYCCGMVEICCESSIFVGLKTVNFPISSDVTVYQENMDFVDLPLKRVLLKRVFR